MQELIITCLMVGLFGGLASMIWASVSKSLISKITLVLCLLMVAVGTVLLNTYEEPIKESPSVGHSPACAAGCFTQETFANLFEVGTFLWLHELPQEVSYIKEMVEAEFYKLEPAECWGIEGEELQYFLEGIELEVELESYEY